MSKVKTNVVALSSYLRSMQRAVGKAERGSEVEDIYFVEKLERAADRLGYRLVEKRIDCG